MTSSIPGMPPNVAQMKALIYGLFRTQAVHVAAALGVADILAREPSDLATLAEATGSHRRSLGRLLRFLVSEGVFSLDSEARFGLTPLGEVLRSDAPISSRHAAIFYGSPSVWAAWGTLGEVIRTGECGFELAHGEPFFSYIDKHESEAAQFNDFMTEMARPRITAAAYDYSGLGTLIDIGGGQGLTLATILEEHPALTGVLFDLPSVVAEAPALLTAAGVQERCSVAAGDFFEAVPAGGDAYLLSNILHDWDDERCMTILVNCRKAMTTGSKLIIVEAVVPEEPSPMLFVDLQMMVVVGGVQRTAAEFRELLEPAGFGAMRVMSQGLIEAAAV
jgi:hypothetical protein